MEKSDRNKIDRGADGQTDPRTAMRGSTENKLRDFLRLARNGFSIDLLRLEYQLLRLNYDFIFLQRIFRCQGAGELREKLSNVFLIN